MSIYAIIAGDEKLMRERLREALKRSWPELEIAAIATNGIEAIEAVKNIDRGSYFSIFACPARAGSKSRRKWAMRRMSCS
jgi:DNA-binding LytR/AlgR family response regulator